MSLKTALQNNREKLIDQWFTAIAGTYPPETARFLAEKRDKFANPMGSTIREALPGIFDAVAGDGDMESAKAGIRDIVRIRAVQDSSPSSAAALFLMLKDVVRRQLVSLHVRLEGIGEELHGLERRIDESALIAFDIYMECREAIWRIKYDEVMNRPFMLQGGGMCPSYLLKKGLLQGEAG